MTRHALQPIKGTGENREQRDASRIVRTMEALILERTTGAKVATLSKLVKEISGELDCNPDRVIAEIIRLRANGKIRVSEQAPYRKLVEYLLSPLSLWFWELVLATLLSMALLFASSGLALYFRFVFGGILVLFLPGYSLVGLTYSKKNDLDYLTRTTLSFALSLAIATIVGLVLNFTPFGITLVAVALSLGAVTIGLLLLTAFRRYDYYRFARIAEAESQSSH